MRHIQSFTNDAAIQDAIDNQTLGKPYVALNNQTGTIDWNSKAPTEPKDMYLTIEALSGGTFYVRNANIGYSVNGADWETTTGDTALALNQGDKVRFKGTAGGNSLFSGNTLAYNVYGNIESLEYGDDYKGQTSVSAVSAFTSCFSTCSGLTDASNLILPVTTLADSCYRNMFFGCTNLASAPELPATILTASCYSNMFGSCTSLTQAPELPATSLADYCYASMFNGCTSLTSTPELPVTTLANYCYRSMFKGCTSLTTAPELPAEILAYGCYNNMFHNCTSLNYIKCLATDISATNCTNNWVKGVSATGTFVKDLSMSNWTTGNNGIPSGWTVIPDIYVLDSEGNYYYPQKDPYGKYYEFEFTIDAADSWTLYKDNKPVEVESGYFDIYNECNGNSKTVDQLTFPHTFENETYTGGFDNPSLAVKLDWYSSQGYVNGGVTAQYCDGSESGSAES